MKIILILFLIFNCNNKSDNKKKNILFSLILLGSRQNIISSPTTTSTETPTNFGIVGDSWTNFISFSGSDLKDQLEQRGFKIVGQRIAGLNLISALNQKLYPIVGSDR